jgi:fibronectin type 3 domain-containing protein
VTSYSVYRGTTASGESAYVSGITTTSYADTGVANGTTYYYKVTAVNAVGEGPQSSEVSATPFTVPGAPTSLVAKPASSKGVTLTWNAPSNGGSAITGYRIYRSRSASSQSYYVTVTCSSGTCSFTDTNTWRGYTYYYRVAATNAAGTGPLSNRASARAT